MSFDEMRERAHEVSGELVGVARALALSPVVWRAGVALAALLVFVVLPSSDDRHFDEVVGVAVIGVALAEQVPRFLGGASPALWRGIVSLVAGALILLWPDATESLVGRMVGAVVLAYGAVRVVTAVREESTRQETIDRMLRGVLLIAVAAAVLVFPDTFTRFALIVIGLTLVIEALIVISAVGRIGPTSLETLALGTTQDNVLAWLAERRAPFEERERIDSTLFFEGEERRHRVFRFYTLMALATTIATFGIASNSTAVVIGAMLIAPLMTPILATAAALLTRRSARMMRSLGLVVSGAVGAVVLAWFLALFLPNLVSVVSNAQIASRTLPNLIDLAIAMAAGAAGAFAVSRADVSDSLPGVAVSIALVPPLAVVGIALRAGDLAQSLGALLLFLTNLVSIIITASIVFVITGYASIRRLQRDTRSLRSTYTGVAIGLVLLLIPLGITGRAIFEDARAERAAEQVLHDWLERSDDFTVASLDVDGHKVRVTVLGPGNAPSPRTLHDALQLELGRPIELELRVVPERVYRFGE